MSFDADWDGFDDINRLAAKLSEIDPRRIDEESRKAAHDFGQRIYDEIMRWLESGRQDWPRLSDVTVLLRGAQGEKNTPKSGEPIQQRGSTQPLVDKGNFKKAIQLSTDASGAVIGILVPRSDDGKDMQMIASIIEGGATLPVTDKMRAYLSAKGVHLRKTTRVLVIPARPLFGPAADLLDENLSEWMQPYEDAVLAEIGLEEFNRA